MRYFCEETLGQFSTTTVPLSKILSFVLGFHMGNTFSHLLYHVLE